MSRPLSPIEQEMQAMQRVERRVPLTLTVAPGLLAGLERLARERQMKPAFYAEQLLEAAYSARRGPTGDAALEAAVAGLDSQTGADAQVRMLRLRLEDMRGEQQNMDARQARALAERDRTIGELQDRLTEAVGRSATLSADEVDALREERDGLANAVEMLKASLKDEEAVRLRLAQDLAELRKEILQAQSAPPAPATALTGAQLRLAQGWKASGWTLREIADALAMPDTVVRSVLMDDA